MKINRLALIGGGTLLLSLLIIIVPWYPWQLSAGLLLIALLPGYALLSALWPFPNNNSLSRIEQWFIAVAVSYGLTITVLLSMVYAHLPLKVITVAGSLGTLTVIFTLLAWWRQAKSQEVPHPQQTTTGLSTPNQSIPVLTSRSQMVWLAVVLVVAALFRIVNVYYSDYQGDEADILYRAVSVVYGQVDAILTHSKGPGEILLLNAIGALTGRFDELTARLPFALAGTAAVGLIVLLGWRFFNPLVGLVAGLLAAIDGVFVSYARTAQYQSVVLLLSLAAIYCFYRYYETHGHLLRWHSLGSFLLAASFLVHFETVLLLPVVAYLTIGPRFKQNWIKNIRQTFINLFPLWSSALIFLAVTATFYVPFLLHPGLGETGNYLENRISGGSLPPFNNLDHFFYFEALKYNSVYYVILFNAIVLLVVSFSLTKALGRLSTKRKSKPISRLTLFLGVTVVVCVLASTALTWLDFNKLSALGMAVGVGLFFALVILSSYTPLADRILWLWLVSPFWVYVFVVNRPGKHHYLFLAAIIIFVGNQLVELWQFTSARWIGLKRPAGRWAVTGISLIVLAIFAAHTMMLFLRNDLEYVLSYPAHRTAFYPTDSAYPYGTRIGFGYPFRLGWQVLGQLKRTGQLNGTWAGNDAGNAPRWYMLGTSATPCYPHYLFQGEITYKGDEDFEVPFEPANFGYTPRYRIWGNDRLRMTVLEFNPNSTRPEVLDLYEPPRFDRPVTAADFAAAMLPQPAPTPQIILDPVPVLGEGSELKNNAPPEYLERAQQLNGRVALLGYDLEDEYASAGSILPITLYWQTQNLLSLRYKVFVHLVSAQGELKTQADDFPACGQSHANTWPLGEITLDRHLLKLSPDMPTGDYTLIVGMYEPDLNLRLNYFDVAGNEQGNSLTVGTITIRGPETSKAGS